MTSVSSRWRASACSCPSAAARSTRAGSTGRTSTGPVTALPDDLEGGEARQQRPVADAGVPERDRDLLVVAGELATDDDAVAPVAVVDAVAIAELAFAGHDRPLTHDRGRPGPVAAGSRGRHRERPRRRTLLVGRA